MTSGAPSRPAKAAGRLRIVHIINSLSTGGAETMLTRLVGAAASSEFQHLVLPLRDGGPLAERIREAGALTRPLEVDGAGNLVTSPVRLAMRLRDLRPDLVQGWLLQGNLAASIGTILARPTTPVLWNVRWTLYDVASERLTTQALLRMSGLAAHQPRQIIFNSRISVSQHASIGYPATRARVIPNGFDVERFRPDPVARSEVRRELGIPAGAEVVGMVARYHPMKDHAMSLRAAARVVQSRPETVFVYAGRGVDADNRELARLIDGSGLGRHVRLLGERHDVGRLYPAFDVYWMSSLTRGIAEGFPNVIAEALASGVPCVATDIGDAASIVGESGRVVRSRDSSAFADATVELLTMGPAIRDELGRQGRERIERDFALGAVLDSYHALYAEVIARAGTSRPKA
jgi:glycosyltransferase involved in cell wall biosynthesis